MPPRFHSCSCHLHRRGFLQLLGAGLTVTLPAAAFAQTPAQVMPPIPQPVPPFAAPLAPVVPTVEGKTLLLICNEPLAWQTANTYMKTRDLAGKYTPVEVSGSAIGLVSDQFTATRAASWRTVTAAITPDVTRVIALDHRGCTALKSAYDVGKLKDGLIETETHRYTLAEFRKQLLARNPELQVEIGLVGGNGKVEMFT
jgi:hypothetical protein